MPRIPHAGCSLDDPGHRVRLPRTSGTDNREVAVKELVSINRNVHVTFVRQPSKQEFLFIRDGVVYLLDFTARCHFDRFGGNGNTASASLKVPVRVEEPKRQGF